MHDICREALLPRGTHTCCALLQQEDAKNVSLCLALSVLGTRMPLGFLAGADRPFLWPQLPLHSERVPQLTWLTVRINCHRALCDPGMQLPTDPNHLLGRKSLSLTLGCQHLPVDTSLSPLFFSLSPSPCVIQLMSGKGCSRQKQLLFSKQHQCSWNMWMLRSRIKQ